MTSRESRQRQAEGVIAPRPVAGQRVSHGPREAAVVWVRPFPNRVPEVSRWGTLVPPGPGSRLSEDPDSLLLSIPFFPLFFPSLCLDTGSRYISLSSTLRVFWSLPSSHLFWKIPIVIAKAILLYLASAYESRIIRHHLTDNLALYPSSTPRCGFPTSKMVNTYGTARKTIHTWLNDPLTTTIHRTSNRFLPLANMPTPAEDLPPTAHRPAASRKQRKAPRRKRYGRSAKRHVDYEDLDLAISGAPLPSDPRTARDGDALPAWVEAPESYVPELGVMLREGVTLDNLPRESPPMRVRVEKRRTRRRRREEEEDMEDWDVVSTCSEESFCVV